MAAENEKNVENNLEKNLLEEQQADYQWYEAAGSHFDIGFTTARQAGSAGFISPGGKLTPAQLDYAQKCREVTAKLYPEIIEEFAGYARALDLPEDDLLGHYTLGVTGGCSAIVMDTTEGRVVGRNYDFFYWENRRHLIRTLPAKGYSHVGMHEGLVGGRFDGLNERGLFVSFNGAGDHPDPAPVGIAFHLIVRYLLEKCADALEAKEALLELPIKEPKSYLVADRRAAFVVEAHPARREVRPLEEGPLVVTNHYVHPDMAAYQPAWPNSVARYNKLAESFPALRQSPRAEHDLRKLLADHSAPLCGHTDGLATFWSCTANLDTGRIAYSLGAPCRHDYRPYFEEVAGPAPAARV